MAPRDASRSVPRREQQVTPAWLERTLAGRFPGAAVFSASREVIGEEFGLSSRLLRVRIDGRGTPGTVVVKLWATDGPAGTREVDFFRTFGPVLESEDLARVPACYHGAIDREARRGVLVLEDVGPCVQGDCTTHLDLRRALRMAREMAAVHARWWGDPVLDSLEWLPSQSKARRTREWIDDRRRTFLDRYGDRLDAFTGRLLDHAEQAQERSNEILSGAPVTLLHADLHLDNVVFEEPGGRPVVLDWARCAKGPAARDLVELALVIPEPGNDETVFTAYLDELRRRGAAIASDDLRAHVGAAVLTKFVTWTCGIVRWEPKLPREEAMIELGLRRAVDIVTRWADQRPEDFSWL